MLSFADLPANEASQEIPWQLSTAFNLWTDAKIWDKIDYCHENPIRRKLVIRPEDWEWSSYRDYRAAQSVGREAID
ncbi:MAG: hypothetical protein JNJ77_04890 [Planctomycetia bacterium]|nr:hypothetical protein [Planctomycetia bacterium]